MSKCKDCGLPLAFTKINGKQFPTNPDGSDHWDLCSQTRTAKAMEKGVPFNGRDGSGFIVDGKEMFMIMSSGWKTGKQYKEQPFSESPPWNVNIASAQP